MNAEIVKQLEDIKEANTDKLVSLVKGNLEKVDAAYYASTVFGSEKDYLFRADYYNSQIVGKHSQKLWNNTLVFTRGNHKKVVTSQKEQGVAMGIVLLDYLSKAVQIAVVVDKAGDEYSYTATVYNKETKKFETAESKATCADFKALLTFFSDKLGLDIAKFNI